MEIVLKAAAVSVAAAILSLVIKKTNPELSLVLGLAVCALIAGFALKAFAELGGRDWGRVDFMISQSGKIHILEINSVPGMTSHSLVPMAAKAVDMSFPELCETILRTAQRRVNHG